MIVEGFNANQVKPSNQVGLHPQLVAYDVVSSDGANVGFNVVGNPESYTPDGRQTAKPGEISQVQVVRGRHPHERHDEGCDAD